MSKASRCFVHIGAPKTGTTLLQKLLSENRNALAKYGILYPAASVRGFGHHDIAYLLAGGYPEYATPQALTLHEIAADLAAEVAKHCGSIVISSENFYLFPEPRALHDLLEQTGCLVERKAAIVVYVRRQDDAHESWYNQTIKAQGCTRDLETCIAQSYDLWDYEKQLTAWAAVFGEGALIVRPYENERFAGGSLITDFFSIFGVSVDLLQVRAERVNSGLNRDLLEFQRIVNKLPMSIQERRRFHRQLIDLSARSFGSGLFNDDPTIDGSRRRALLERYANGNAQIAKTFLGRQTLFFQEPSSKPQLADSVSSVLTASQELTTEKLCLILGWLLSRDR